MIGSFDCDGVILQSNRIKTDAFRVAALAYGEGPAEALVAHHVAHGGISRRRKFQHFFDAILGRAPREGEVEALLDAFARSVAEGLAHCPTVPGIEDALHALSRRGWTLYVISGGDPDEIRAALRSRGLLSYFADVYGGATPKRSAIAKIMETAPSPSAMFWGDSREDYLSAVAAGVPFTYVSGTSEWVDASSTLPPDTVRIADFTDPRFGAWLATAARA
jgi:phosphoglycolate phosphatase-like HAD superfamily hydrolase